jgi:hypothetical protein
MPPITTVARTFNSRVSGYRGRGRPRKRWINRVGETLQKLDLSRTEGTHLAIEWKLQFPTTLNGTSGKKKVSKNK